MGRDRRENPKSGLKQFQIQEIETFTTYTAINPRKKLKKKLFHIERGIPRHMSEELYILSTPHLNPHSPLLKLFNA
jgi:hypothetical protein